MDVVDIPIGRVALEHAIGTRFPIGQDIRAAIQISVVARAEILAHLFAEFAVARHEADIGKHGFKVGDRLFERVFQRVIINRLDADIFPITFAVKVRFSVFAELADYISLICVIDSALSWTAAEMRAHSVRVLLIMKFHLSAVCF